MITDERREKLAEMLGRHRVAAAYLFGSHATGKANELSDVDIAVLFAEGVSKDERFDAVLEISDGVQRILGVREVDVVDMEEATLSLKFEILRDGRLLYCSDRSRMVLFCARSRSLYFDFEPAREVYRSFLVKRIKEGRLGERTRRPSDS